MSCAAPELYDEFEAGNGSDRQGNNVEELEMEAQLIAKRVAAEVYGQAAISTINLLGQGGYNSIRVVNCDLLQMKQETFILRIHRNKSSLQPYQTHYEVACLRYFASNVPSVPVPKLYSWDDGVAGSSLAFIAEEYIDGQRLSVVWPQLTDEQKSDIRREIANVSADLGETRFASTGSLTPDLSLGRTVEVAKWFNGKSATISANNANSKGYVLACYDREIYFYSHADPTVIEDFFETTSVSDFVEQLKHRRQELANGDSGVFAKIDAEPLVLVHDDFHASNILVREGKLLAVLDWEFSGVYPLSDLLGLAQIVQISGPLEERDEAMEAEEDRWDAWCRREVGEVVKRREWAEKDIDTLLSGGDELLRDARMIMFPQN